MGTAAGFAAVGFHALIPFIQNAAYFGSLSAAPPSLLDRPFAWWVVLVPAAGGLAAGILTYFVASEARGHGVPVVMEATAMHEGRIRARVMGVQALASGITIGTGGSAGREGPIVQIGASGGSTIARLFRLPPYMTKILVACGAAGGIAATFNTPIGGVLFAIEVVLLELKTRSFIPLVVASVFATIVSRLFLGRRPAFDVPPYAFQHPVELLFYLLLGVFAGLVAVLFINTLYRLEDWFGASRLPAVVRPALGGLLVGALGLGLPQILGVGYDTVSAILQQHYAGPLLIGLVAAKIVAVSLTLGSGGSGGVFAPSLFLGASLGGAFGALMHQLAPSVTASSGAYALVGMAAVFAGTSRATLTAILILFEMTQDYQIILPLMFGCVVSDLVAYTIEPDSIYTRKLRLRGIHIVQDLEPDALARIRVTDVMTREYETVLETDTVKTVFDRLLAAGRRALPVVDAHQQLAGIVTHLDVSRAFQEGREDEPVSTIAHRELVTAWPDQRLRDVIGEFTEFGQLPVVDRLNPRQLLGVLTRADLLKAQPPEIRQRRGRPRRSG